MALDFKRILAPVDLSGFSLDAVRLAAKLAMQSNASLYLFHVIDNPLDELYMTPITRADPAMLEHYVREPRQRAKVLQNTIRHTKVRLKQFCQNEVRGVRRVVYLVETGNPFERILDIVEIRRIDLIVLATHGRTGIRRLIIGNVAEKVVRHAPCPVLTLNVRTRRRKAPSR